MNICFDVFPLSHLPNTGVYSYSYELINRLTNEYPQPKYSLITNNNPSSFSLTSNKKVTIDMIDINRKENDYNLISQYLEKNRVTLFHSLNNGFSIPKEKNCKYVVTIHDMLPFKNSKIVDNKYFNKFMKSMPNALEKSDKIIAVSNLINDELISYCNVPKSKIEVIQPSVSSHFKPISKVESRLFLEKYYDIKGDFLLYAGSLHERKNLPLIFSVFKNVMKTYKNVKLVIVGSLSGKRESYYLKLIKLARKLGIEENIIFTGSIEYVDMPYFYNAALSFLNLSIYDGFPLTSVEARACNTPVICSSFIPFKEVLGSYPIYVRQNDPKDIANIILDLLEKGEETYNLEQFNTDHHFESMQSIKKLIRVYESIVYR